MGLDKAIIKQSVFMHQNGCVEKMTSSIATNTIDVGAIDRPNSQMDTDSRFL
jgi:hypothetical protein